MKTENLRQTKQAKHSARVSENKALRDAIAWAGSQASLAYRMGVTRCQISGWVADNTMPARQAIRLEVISNGEFKAVDLFVFPADRDADDF